MKKRKNKYLLVIISVIILIFAVLFIISFKISGNVVVEQHTIGPSSDEQACMMSCMKCTSPGVGCSGDSAACQAQCNVKKPEVTEETGCMETCVLRGCGEYDFSCQGKNQQTCEKECNMIKAPDESTMSAEQLCITNCVNAESPGTICGASQTGETGSEMCKRCADSCVHLYEGPCLGDEKLKAKQKECETCEHCYGEPVMGDSGEGWECIVDVECKDASSEWGDNPGVGEGIGKGIGNIVDAIGEFFGNLFGGDKNTEISK